MSNDRAVRVGAARAALVADRIERLRSRVRELGGDPLTVQRATVGKVGLAIALEAEIARIEAGERPTVFCLRPCCDFHGGSHLV